jgi:hypothetical protein
VVIVGYRLFQVNNHTACTPLLDPTIQFVAIDDYPGFQPDPLGILASDIDAWNLPRRNWDNCDN